MVLQECSPTWLRGLDLNQRPLGYEGKSGRQSYQDEPTETNDARDLQDEKVVSRWFVLVGLLHRDFIAGSDRRADLFEFTACRTFVHI